MQENEFKITEELLKRQESYNEVLKKELKIAIRILQKNNLIPNQLRKEANEITHKLYTSASPLSQDNRKSLRY